MGISTGKVGAFKIEAVEVGENIEGTLNIEQAIEETTKIGDEWGSSTMLGRKWDVALSCNYDDTNATQAALLTAIASGTAGECALSAISFDNLDTSAFVYAGSAILTNAVIVKSVGTPDKLNVTVMGQGVLTRT